MADNEAEEIAALQAARRAQKENGQRTNGDSSSSALSVKKPGEVSNRKSAYDTSIGVGGPDEDVDMDDADRPVRLVDSCKLHRCQTTGEELMPNSLCNPPMPEYDSHRAQAPSGGCRRRRQRRSFRSLC